MAVGARAYQPLSMRPIDRDRSLSIGRIENPQQYRAPTAEIKNSDFLYISCRRSGDCTALKPSLSQGDPRMGCTSSKSPTAVLNPLDPAAAVAVVQAAPEVRLTAAAEAPTPTQRNDCEF
jgi:hypothetical protein